LRDGGGAAVFSALRAVSVDARKAPIRDVLPVWSIADSAINDAEPDGAREVGARAVAPGDLEMTKKPEPKDTRKNPATPHPGMMGDGTEEQNLGQPGNPAARIKKDEVDAAFSKNASKNAAKTK